LVHKQPHPANLKPVQLVFESNRAFSTTYPEQVQVLCRDEGHNCYESPLGVRSFTLTSGASDFPSKVVRSKVYENTS